MGEVSTWEFGLLKCGGGGAEDNTLRFVVGSSDDVSAQYVQSTTVITAGVWYHVASVMSGTTMQLYINGKLEASAGVKLARRKDLDGSLTLGASPEYSAGIVKDVKCFNGEMDEVRLWGHARTGSRIQGAILDVLTGNEPGLQAYYPMANGSGETVDDDQKDGKNKGRIFDAVWSKAEPLPVSMVAFAGMRLDGGVLLRWSTASEVNNYGFDVERRASTAGIWEKIGFVEGKGTTVVPQDYRFTDGTASSGTYLYRLIQTDLDGARHVSEVITVDVTAGATDVASQEAVPLTTALAQNYPNPFNPSTTIEFTVAKSGPVRLVVYDLLGREVAVLADGEFASGVRHRVQFDGSRLSSGMYFYRLTAGEAVAMHSLILAK